MVKAQEIFRQFCTDPKTTLQDLHEALERGRTGKPGGLRPEDFSLRDLAASFITDRHGEPIGLAGLEAYCRGTHLLEADGVLTTSAFATITGQILNAAVLEGYQLPEFTLSRLVPAIDGRARQARLAGVSLPLADGKTLQVAEGQEYPALGMYDEYVKTPETVKRGAIVRITKEAILQDETGQILDQARRIGERIGLEKETALVDYIVGAVSGCVVEKRVGDSAEGSYNLFYSTTGSRYVNQQVNALADWTDVDAAEDLFLGIQMPGTGQPPILTQRVILVPPQLRSTANRIVSATETRSGSSNVVVAGNPLAGMNLQVVVSSLVYSRLVASGQPAATAAGIWFYGDLTRAFRYYRNWDLQVEEDRSGALAFSHDVVAAFKASERGTPVVVEPRLWSRQMPS
jgi:hypothetical protein